MTNDSFNYDSQNKISSQVEKSEKNANIVFTIMIMYFFPDGLDFFYATENQARKMVDFIQSVLPIKSSHSKKLISHDIHSNVYNYKFTFCIEIVPLSKDSLVCLPKKLTNQLGGISPICLVNRVTSFIHLIDASTAQGKIIMASFFTSLLRIILSVLTINN